MAARPRHCEGGLRHLLSYRWNKYDQAFVQKLFDYSNYNVHSADHERVVVFLDRQRLQDGKDFQKDFVKALYKSYVIVPILSLDALSRFTAVDEKTNKALFTQDSPEDNLLVEWILALHFIEDPKCRLKRIFPIAFGARAGEGEAMTIGDLFKDGLLKALPEVVPTATIELARKYLRELQVKEMDDLSTLTVQKVVRRMMVYQLLPTWESKYPVKDLAKEVSMRIEKVLRAVYSEEASKASSSAAKSAEVQAAPPASVEIAAAPSPVKSEKTLVMLINDIKEQLGIDGGGPAAVLNQAYEMVIADDEAKKQKYNQIQKMTEKALYILELI